MSTTTVLAVTPGRRPIDLAEWRNAWGWAPSIWTRLLIEHGHSGEWFPNDSQLPKLWERIEDLPEWQQVPLLLTFDTGVLPFQVFDWAADQLDEFEKRCPEKDGHANHLTAMAELLRSSPETPFIGVWGTSVSDNPFDPWDETNDRSGSGVPLSALYLLPQHREHIPTAKRRR